MIGKHLSRRQLLDRALVVRLEFHKLIVIEAVVVCLSVTVLIGLIQTVVLPTRIGVDNPVSAFERLPRWLP